MVLIIFCRDLRVTKNTLREACVAATLRVARHKAQRNFFKKEAIYGLFFELQLLVAKFSSLLGGLLAAFLLSWTQKFCKGEPLT